MLSPKPITDEQAKHARLAQALRELAETVGDQHLGMAGETPLIWPQDNVRWALNEAAELIDTLTLKAGAAR